MHIAAENSLPDAVVGNVILLIGGKDLVPLHNVLELDRVEQVMKVEFGRSILVAYVGKVRHTAG